MQRTDDDGLEEDDWLLQRPREEKEDFERYDFCVIENSQCEQAAVIDW